MIDISKMDKCLEIARIDPNKPQEMSYTIWKRWDKSVFVEVGQDLELDDVIDLLKKMKRYAIIDEPKEFDAPHKEN